MIKHLVHKKYLPIFIGCLFLLVPSIAHAGWLEDLAMELFELALNAMGIDTDVSCSTPHVDKSFCLFCPMFKAVFNAGSIMAGRAYNVFSSDLAEVLLIFLGVSLSLIILKQLATMNAKDAGSMLNDILRKVFVVIVIYMIISQNYYQILSLTLVPVFEAVMSFISTNNDPQSMVSCSHSGGIVGFGSELAAQSRGGIPMSVGKMIVCCVQSIENKINLLFEYGEWAICRGTGPDKILFLIPRIIAIVDGIILYIAGVFFMMTYPWVMADAVLQLGIAMTLLPFAVCGFAFNGTKNYLSKVWSWILNTLFIFMFMAILLNCLLGYIESILLNATTSVSAGSVFYDGNRGLAFWGPNMFMLLFVLVLAWSYMPIIPNLAKNFASGTGIQAGAKVGGAVASKLEDSAEKMANKAGEVAASSAKHVYQGAKNGARHLARAGTQAAVNKYGKDNGNGGKTVNLFGMHFDTDVDQNTGKTIIKRSWTNPINGRRHVTSYDRYSTVKELYDKDGNLIGNNVKFRHSFVNDHLFDDQGNINQEAMQKILDSPMAQDPKHREMIMAKFAEMGLEKKGIKVGKYYRSRKIITDPNNPNKILVEQVDHGGRITRYSMEIDPTTGRTALSHMTKHKNGDASFYVNNGLVEISTRRKSNGEEVTTYQYSDEAQKNHAHFADHRDKNKIVDSTGKIAKDLDPSQGGKKDLMFGMDSLSELGIVPMGVDAKEYVVHEVLAKGARNRTNRLRTSTLQEVNRAQEVVDATGKIDNKAVLEVINSDFVRSDPQRRKQVMNTIAMQALEKRGYTFSDTYKSRDVTFDPKNPNRLLIRQVNSSGHITNASLEINPYTGQSIISYYDENIQNSRYGTTDDKQMYFDNGNVEIKSYRRWGASGTTFNYSSDIMDGRRGIGDVVDSTGKIATGLETDNFHKTGLLYGIDALNSTANLQGDYAEDMVRKEILAEGTRTGSTTVNVDFMDQSYNKEALFDQNGDIVTSEMRNILNSNIGSKAEYREKIFEKVANDWAEKKNMDISGTTRTLVDPNTYKLETKDRNGNVISTITMTVDSRTGATIFNLS